MNPLPPKELLPGAEFRACKGNYQSLPTFDHLTLSYYGAVEKLGFEKVYEEPNLAIEFEAWFPVPEAGSHRFELRSVDGSRLWIDRELVVDNDGLHPLRKEQALIVLSEGWHQVKLQYFCRDIPFSLECSFQGPRRALTPLADAGLCIDAEIWRKIERQISYRDC